MSALGRPGAHGSARVSTMFSSGAYVDNMVDQILATGSSCSRPPHYDVFLGFHLLYGADSESVVPKTRPSEHTMLYTSLPEVYI